MDFDTVAGMEYAQSISDNNGMVTTSTTFVPYIRTKIYVAGYICYMVAWSVKCNGEGIVRLTVTTPDNATGHELDRIEIDESRIDIRSLFVWFNSGPHTIWIEICADQIGDINIDRGSIGIYEVIKV